MRKERRYTHTPFDGRGRRDVFVDGVKVHDAIKADTMRGIVWFCERPFRIDEQTKRVITKTIRGVVTVRPIAADYMPQSEA
jgi:hypothetical protein